MDIVLVVDSRVVVSRGACVRPSVPPYFIRSNTVFGGALVYHVRG